MADETNGARHLLQIANGDIVDTAEMATDLAEVLVRHRYGEDCLKTQQPLSARDAGEYWAVEGAADASDERNGLGPVRIEMKKSDGQVASLYFALCSSLQEKLKGARTPNK